MFNVAADFLRAQKSNAQLGVIYRRAVGAAGTADRVARFCKKRNGRFHQATGG